MRQSLINIFALSLFVILSSSQLEAQDSTAKKSKLWYGVTSSLTNVFKDIPISNDEKKVINLKMAKGETESAQIVLYTREKKKLAVKISPLYNENGKPFPAENIVFRKVGYVYITKNTNLDFINKLNPPDALLRFAPAEFPDPLFPFDTLDIAPNANNVVYLSFRANRDLQKGLYKGHVNLVVEEDTLTIPTELKVLDIILPEETPIKISNWFWPDKIAEQYKIELFSEDFWRLLRVYAGDMKEHGQNTFTTEWNLIKITFDGGKYGFDFSKFDRWVETFFDSGFDTIELMQLAVRTTGQWLDTTFSFKEFKAVNEKTGDTLDVPVELLIQATYDHLLHKHWLDKAVIHIADEPIPENEKSWKSLSKFVHEQAPKLRRIEAIQTSNLDKHLEIWIPLLNMLHQDLNIYKQKQQKDHAELWYYTCVFPQEGYPNRFLDFSLLKSRLTLWVALRYRLEGYLHWGYNYWNKEVSHDHNLFAPGDDFIVYPGAEGPLTSLRWETFRDAIEDLKLMNLLLKKNPDLFDQIVSQVMPHANSYLKDEEEFLRLRESVLLELSKQTYPAKMIKR